MQHFFLLISSYFSLIGGMKWIFFKLLLIYLFFFFLQNKECFSFSFLIYTPISELSASQCIKHVLCLVSQADTLPLLVEIYKVLSPAYSMAVKSTGSTSCKI
jgi:hypothetical protein